MHAVTALAKRHRAHISNEKEDLDVLGLKDRALSSFATVLDRTHPEAMIGTILALIGLEVSSHYRMESKLPAFTRSHYSSQQLSMPNQPSSTGLSISRALVGFSNPVAESVSVSTTPRFEVKSPC